MPVYREIKRCRLCGSETLYEVLNLGVQYIVDFVPERNEQAPRAPLLVVKCKDCDLVQLKHSVQPDLLYKKFWYRSGINESMRNALREIVDFASDMVEPKQGDSVLDIGANDGTLLGWYAGNVRTIGVDPCGEVLDEGVKAKRVDIGIKSYFSADVVKPYAPFKVITAIAMFYDLDDPVGFLKECKQVLAPDGVMVVQMNYLVGMLKNCAVDNIAHEHLTYFTMSTMKRCVEAAGLEIVGAQENDVNGGSIRIFITHNNASLASPMIGTRGLDIFMKYSDMMHREGKMALDKPAIYQQFAGAIIERSATIVQYLRRLKEDNQKVYIYGASTRGTVLMQVLNLSEGLILGAAERDEKKYGLHMVGGTWPEIYPEEYCRSRATHFLVLPWHFRESVVERESQWMARGGKMIFPLPVPTLAVYGGITSPLAKELELQPMRGGQ